LINFSVFEHDLDLMCVRQERVVFVKCVFNGNLVREKGKWNMMGFPHVEGDNAKWVKHILNFFMGYMSIKQTYLNITTEIFKCTI
jgi:hypothetical protein